MFVQTAIPADLGDGVINGLLGDQVGLVTDQKLVDALNGVTVDLLQPLLDIRVGICLVSFLSGELDRQIRLTAVRDIVNDDNSVCAPVIG